MRTITRGASAGAGLIFHVFVADSAATDGAGKASVAFSSFSCRYIRSGEALSGAITPEDITTIGTYAAPTANTNIRIKAVDNTNAIGLYEVQIHADWVNATNACQSLSILLQATGAAVLPIQIPLEAVNAQDAVRGGMTALPNAAADAAGGLPISDAGGLDLDARLDAAVSSRSTLTQTQVSGGAYALNSASFAFNAAMDFTTAQKAATLARVTLVDTVTAVTGLTAADVGAIKTKTDFLPSATAGSAGGVFIAGANAATTVNFTGNITGNLSGSVGSVTGSVGSVTGLTPTTIATETLLIDWTGIAGPVPDFCLFQAARSTRNDWSMTAVAGKRRVYEEDGATTAFDQTVGTDPTAIPIVSASTP